VIRKQGRKEFNEERRVKFTVEENPPELIFWDVVVSPAGKLVVGWSAGSQVYCSSYLKKRKIIEVISDWQIRWKKTKFIKGKFIGDLSKKSLVLVGSKFQHQVLKAVMAIPRGTVTSFGKLAESIGRSGASRAIGTACTKNPLRFLVPCYRVLGSDGSLRDSASGPEVQRELLELEGYSFESRNARVKNKRG
jgi:O-6-methylguanine DNA methyltransferase